MILNRVYQFVRWLVITGAAGIILLMIVRVIANAADLNPFTWTALTIRRLSEPMLGPVRRGLMRFRIDPKYSPLFVILLVILLALFTLQVISTLTNTIIGVWMSIQAGALGHLLGYLLYGLLSLYSLVIFVRIVLSWGTMGYGNPMVRFLINITEPLLAPLRRMIPPVGMLDISPIVAFIVVWICQAIVVETLLKGARVQFVG